MFALERGSYKAAPFPQLHLVFPCVEILVKRIRTNKDIKGISTKGNEIKLANMPTTGTRLILNDSEKSFATTLHDLQLFSTISVLKVNYIKT